MMNHEKVIICKDDIGPDDNVKKTAKHEWDEKEDSDLILFISVSALYFSIHLITFFFFKFLQEKPWMVLLYL